MSCQAGQSQPAQAWAKDLCPMGCVASRSAHKQWVQLQENRMLEAESFQDSVSGSIFSKRLRTFRAFWSMTEASKASAKDVSLASGRMFSAMPVGAGIPRH